MTNAVTISAPATGTVGQTIAVSGTVSPATDTVSLMLSQQNATLPTSPSVSATTANGSFAGVLAIPAAGTWYVWAWDQATGAQAVSAAIAVPNAAQTAVLAVPMPASEAGSLLPTLNNVAAEATARAAGDATNAAAAAAAQATANAAMATANGALSSASPIITAPLSNPATIAHSCTIPTTSNAVSVGPITVAIGASVTVPINSTWKVL